MYASERLIARPYVSSARAGSRWSRSRDPRRDRAQRTSTGTACAPRSRSSRGVDGAHRPWLVGELVRHDRRVVGVHIAGDRVAPRDNEADVVGERALCLVVGVKGGGVALEAVPVAAVGRRH
eukprot:629989-Prymnesium_polylepis.1